LAVWTLSGGAPVVLRWGVCGGRSRMHPARVLFSAAYRCPYLCSVGGVVVGAWGEFLGVLAKADARSRVDDGDALRRRSPC
jgi:hypothetical protein